MIAKLRSLYVCYLSLDDPLVESQVVAYLDGLVEQGPHDPPVDVRDAAVARQATRASQLDAIPRSALARPSVPQAAIVGGDGLRRRLRRGRLRLAGAAIPTRRGSRPQPRTRRDGAMLAAPFARHRLIFDMRGLMAEEYVDAGRWRSGGMAFRITKRVERAAIRRACGTVVLTQRVRRALFGEQRRADVFVIPCCADVERIEAQRANRDATRAALGLGDRPVIVYVGKLGGWYMDAEMVDFFAVARDAIPRLHFLLITQADGSTIERQFARREIGPADYTVTTVEHAQLGETIAAGDIAIALIKPLPSKVASSPTKIGEYLAAGLPTLGTDVGDVKELLERSRVGVVLEEFSDPAYRAAVKVLAEMLGDEGARSRCVASARAHLSLRAVGIPTYAALYRSIAEQDAGVESAEQSAIQLVDRADERIERERLG